VSEPVSDRASGGQPSDPVLRIVQREIVVLTVLCVVAVLGFLLTRAAAAANRELRLRDAAFWYQSGQQHLAAGDPADAVAALRRATAIDRDNRRYRLDLAHALASDRRDDAARQVLLGLREATPEDPEVNLQLARLEVRRNDLTSAVRYYQNALYGLWSGDPAGPRRLVRIELIQYLLAHAQRARGLSELLILTANLPDDPDAHQEAGQLFLDADEPRRALEEFRRVLRADSGNGAALAGAGEAAFRLGDYASARRYLQGSDLSSAREAMREIADLVLERDPLRPGLSLPARHERVVLDVDRARHLLERCRTSPGRRPSDATLDALTSEIRTLEPRLSLKGLRRSPEIVDRAVDLVYRVAQQTVDVCADATTLDRALLIIGRRRDAERQ
jgi:Flp pilus assembly protein TadD